MAEDEVRAVVLLEVLGCACDLILVLVGLRSTSAGVFFASVTASNSVLEAEDEAGRTPTSKEKDPTSTAALSRTNGMRPMEVARKMK